MDGETAMKLGLTLQGRVNASPFRGRPAGTLVVAGCDWRPGLPFLVGLCDRPTGWNNYPASDGRHYPIRSVTTFRPLYESVEFPPEGPGLQYIIDGEDDQIAAVSASLPDQ